MADGARPFAATRPVAGVRIQRDSSAPMRDEVVVEEPLAIRLAGELVATTMRTPGADRELALGYLFSQGAIRALSEVTSVVHCGRPGSPDFGNLVEVTPSPGLTLEDDPVARLDPSVPATSACGVCGRERIDELARRCSALFDTRLELTPT